MRKKLLSSLLALSMIVGMLPTTALATESDSGGRPPDTVPVTEVTASALPDAVDNKITLVEDVALEGPYVVPQDTTLTIDLAGFKLTYSSEVLGEAMITNHGVLTINDSSNAKTGEIYYDYTGANDPSYGKGNYTISNCGTLTVNGGKIHIADLRQHAKYPIDNNSTTGDAVLTINGGHLYNYNTSAIRQFCNSTTYQNSVTVNGGLIQGYCAIWIQNPGKNAVNGKLTVAGGEIRTTAAAYVNGTADIKDVSSSIYCTISGVGGGWSAGSSIKLIGGTFNENVNLTVGAPVVVIGEGASFNGSLGVSATAAAQIGETLYTSLDEAVAAAQAEDEIDLLKDIALADGVTIPAGKTVTLDLNGKTLSGNTDKVESTAVIVNYGTLSILDSSAGKTGKVTAFAENPDVASVPAYANNTISNSGTLNLYGGTIENSTGDEARACFPIDNNSSVGRNAVLNIYGGTVTGRGAIRQFTTTAAYINVVNIYGGTIYGRSYALWLQNPAGTGGDPHGELNIEGGTLSKILLGSSSDFDVAISGGEITEVAYWDPDTTNTSRIPAGFITGGTFSSDPSAYMPQGCTCVDNDDGTYTVTDSRIVENTTTGKKYTSLHEAVEEAGNGDIVTLLNDVEMTSFVEIKKPMTLDLNGFDITRSAEKRGTGLCVKDAVVNIQGKGTIDTGAQALMALGGTVNIDGGTFVGGGAYEAVLADYDSQVFIHDGTFYSEEGGDAVALGDSCTTASIKVDGGTFVNFDPVSYVVEGYVSVTGGNNTYTVTVGKAVTGITLDEETLSLTVGDSAALTATVMPNDALDKDVTWASDTTDVAEVEDGVVTAVAPGTAIISVTTVDGGFTDTCTVVVTRPVTYTITLDANGGSCGTATLTAVDGVAIGTLPTPTHRNNYYRFKGWFTAPAGGSQVSAETIFTEPITLYAQWRDDTPSYDDGGYTPSIPSTPSTPVPTPTPPVIPEAPKVDVDSPTVDTETKTDDVTGATTTTETKQDGTKVETTTNTDGSSTTTASKTETSTNADGSTTTTTATNTTTETATGDKVTEEKVEAKVENKDGSTTTTTATNTTTETAVGDKVTETKVEEKVENKDGSTTTTTSTTTETKAADGSTETVRTEEKMVEKDNETTKSTTTEIKNEAKTETVKTEEKTVTNGDGTTTTTKTTETDTKAADGSTGITKTDETGKTEAEVKVSSAAVTQAAKAQAPVALPMPALEVSKKDETSATVTVALPAGASEATVAIPVAEGTGEGTVAVLVNADGTETILTNAVITENGLVANVPNGATVKVVDNSASFDDISDTGWEKDAVDFASSRNITYGTGDGFSPDMVTSRAMVWTMLARLEGVDTTPAEGDDWWSVGQKWAMEKGISDGTNAGGEVTREQVAVMLHRFMGEPEEDHTDELFDDSDQTSDWARAAKEWAVSNKIINGKDNADGTLSLDPAGDATRAEVAQMLMNFIKNVKA